MKGRLLYLLGALGVLSLIKSTSPWLPDLGGLRAPLLAAVTLAIWIPLHRWLTHTNQHAIPYTRSPDGTILKTHQPMTAAEAADFEHRWRAAYGPRPTTTGEETPTP